MEGLIRALGFGSKPDYAEKIPETLTAKDFCINETFHHGYPSQPTCLEYDPIQQLLAVGTEDGAVLLLGKPGLERHFKHPDAVGVTKLQFITNKGMLVTCCNNDMLYLWSLKSQEPQVLHTLQFTREKDGPTCLEHVYGSEWLYVGSKEGTVYLVNIPSFVLSGLIIRWNQALGALYRVKPGQVLTVLEHPMDQGKILIGYTCGLCVLYNLKHHDYDSSDSRQGSDNKIFSYQPPGESHIITSVCWVSIGRQFACSYSDGSIVIWNIKSEAKPEKIFYLHESDPSQFKAIYKLQVFHTDGEPLYLCSGGFPEHSDEAPRTLTLTHGKSSSMLSCSSTIIDFLCLHSTPHLCDCQKPFALVIIAKNEIIFHDLLTPGYPKFPSYVLPYALDIHLPAVSYIHYSPLCPEEFIAQLHSVKSKMMTTSTKPWPLNGGKWGEEVPHSSTDIIVTGHVDGSVRLWNCNSVIFQPFFTVDTSRYFKRRYTENPTKSSPSSKSSPTANNSSPSRGPLSRPPPPSHPPPKSKKASERLLNASTPPTVDPPPAEGPESSSAGEVEELGSSGSQDGGKVAASPATGQVHAVEQNQQTDGVERKTISYKDKSSKKKKDKASKMSSKTALELPTPLEEGEEGSGSSSGKKHGTTRRSFQKMAKIVKLTRSSSGDKGDKGDKGQQRQPQHQEDVDQATIDEVPETTEDVFEIVDSAVSVQQQQEQEQQQQQQQPLPVEDVEAKPRKKRPPPRPNVIALKKESQMAMGAVSSSGDEQYRKPKPHPRSTTTPQVQQDEGWEGPGSRSRHSPHRLTSRFRFQPRPRSTLEEEEDDFFVINYVHLCVCGLWLCVANNGGNVMAFDFCTAPPKPTKQPGFLDINFDYDSIKKQYTPSTTPLTGAPGTLSSSAHKQQHPQPSVPSPHGPAWTYEDRVSDSSTGYQLTQLCRCFYTAVAGGNHPTPPTNTTTPSSSSAPSVSKGLEMPVAINEIQYSVDIGLLAIATRRGVALVDTRSNNCIYTLSSCISILYLSDPSKFTNQMKRESRMNVMGRPSIKRHGTSIRFNVDPNNTRATSRRRIQSALDNGGKSKAGLPCPAETEEDTFEVSVEMDSCVSTLELVQLQMDKMVLPTLTLWVGLANGYVAAYMVNVVKSAKRIELVPTRVLVETKSPVVNILFLNEWGDQQVVPYTLNKDLTGDQACVGKKQTMQRLPSHSPLSVPSTQHYAIIVDEEKIKSYSFPGFNKISHISLPLNDGNVVLRSEYFTCNGLPCLASMTSCHSLYIHSLPGVKFLTALPLTFLGDPQATATFRISGIGQGLYMASPSEIQRISVINDNILNFPDCLPMVFTKRADTTPNSGKGFLGALFSGGPTTINREDIFGTEGSQHAIGNVARVDGKLCRAYGSSRGKVSASRMEQHKTSPNRSAAADAPSGSSRRGRTVKERKGGEGGSGLSGQMNRNISALSERKEKLGAIEQRTGKVADAASSYADLATRLAQKYGAK